MAWSLHRAPSTLARRKFRSSLHSNHMNLTPYLATIAHIAGDVLKVTMPDYLLHRLCTGAMHIQGATPTTKTALPYLVRLFGLHSPT